MPAAPVSNFVGTWRLALVEGKNLPAVKSVSAGTGLCCGGGTLDLESVTVIEGTLVIYSNQMATLDYRSSEKLVSGVASGSAVHRVFEWDQEDGGLRFFESKSCQSWACPAEGLAARAMKNGAYLEFSHALKLAPFIDYMDNSAFIRKPVT